MKKTIRKRIAEACFNTPRTAYEIAEMTGMKPQSVRLAMSNMFRDAYDIEVVKETGYPVTYEAKKMARTKAPSIAGDIVSILKSGYPEELDKWTSSEIAGMLDVTQDQVTNSVCHLIDRGNPIKREQGKGRSTLYSWDVENEI
jgi:biotin operon repressor